MLVSSLALLGQSFVLGFHFSLLFLRGCSAVLLSVGNSAGILLGGATGYFPGRSLQGILNGEVSPTVPLF